MEMNTGVWKPLVNSITKQITITYFECTLSFVLQASIELLLTTGHLEQKIKKSPCVPSGGLQSPVEDRSRSAGIAQCN